MSAGAEVRQTRLQAQPIIACAGRAILMEVTVIDTGKEESIALQVNGLALVSGRDPHVADQHVRQTSKRLLSHTGPIRQGLSRRKAACWRATFRTQPVITGNSCLSSAETQRPLTYKAEGKPSEPRSRRGRPSHARPAVASLGIRRSLS